MLLQSQFFENEGKNNNSNKFLGSPIQDKAKTATLNFWKRLRIALTTYQGNFCIVCTEEEVEHQRC